MHLIESCPIQKRLSLQRKDAREREHKIRLCILILPFAHNYNSLRLWSYRYHNSLRFAKTCSRPLQCDLFPIRELPRSFASGSLTGAIASTSGVEICMDIICSEKQTFFWESNSGKTVSFEEQIMSKDKYPSIFSRQMKAIVFIIFQILFATHAVLKIGEYQSDIPQF